MPPIAPSGAPIVVGRFKKPAEAVFAGASAKAPIRCDSAVPPHLPPGSAKVPGFPDNVPGWHSVRPRVRPGQTFQPFVRGAAGTHKDPLQWIWQYLGAGLIQHLE